MPSGRVGVGPVQKPSAAEHVPANIGVSPEEFDRIRVESSPHHVEARLPAGTSTWNRVCSPLATIEPSIEPGQPVGLQSRENPTITAMPGQTFRNGTLISQDMVSLATSTSRGGQKSERSFDC